MKDLTQGSITSHILTMSLVMLIGMAGQTAYFLVDLYFVAHLGPKAIAGVNAAGTLVVCGDGAHADPRCRHAGVDRACGRQARQAGREHGLQSVRGAVCDLRSGHAGCRLSAYGCVSAIGGRRCRDAGERRDVSAVVSAEPRTSVRVGLDGTGFARHGHREAGHRWCSCSPLS